MSNEIYNLGRNEIHEWVVVAVDTERWTDADGDSCGENFYRQDLTPFVIGDRARVIDTDEDGIEETESAGQVLDRLTEQASERANQMWGESNWTQIEFLEKVWHHTTTNPNHRGGCIWPENLKSTYPVVQHRYARDWQAEQQAEKDQQLDAWFVV
jgi:hypothetical protein